VVVSEIVSFFYKTWGDSACKKKLALKKKQGLADIIGRPAVKILPRPQVGGWAARKASRGKASKMDLSVFLLKT